jgi:heme/copper-type cytochrome/quinol oxidase subunit 3
MATATSHTAASHTAGHSPAPYQPRLADAPEPTPRRPRVLLIAAAMAAAASILTILTMLSAYLGLRSEIIAGQATQEGEAAEAVTALPEGVDIPLTPGTMNVGTLVMSAITAAWIVYALRNRDRPHAYLALGLTILFGIAFITQTVFLYTEMGFEIAASPQAVLVYAITGAHIAMTVGGLLFLAVMGFHALGGQLTGRDADSMSAATLYWYATVAVYMAIWYGIYVTK